LLAFVGIFLISFSEIFLSSPCVTGCRWQGVALNISFLDGVFRLDIDFFERVAPRPFQKNQYQLQDSFISFLKFLT